MEKQSTLGVVQLTWAKADEASQASCRLAGEAQAPNEIPVIVSWRSPVSLAAARLR